jgi:hypothetical protein
MTDLDLREQIARIDREQAHLAQLQADRDRKRQEMALAPWQLILAGVTAGAGLMAAGAGLFAAGGVYLKFMGGL